METARIITADRDRMRKLSAAVETVREYTYLGKPWYEWEKNENWKEEPMRRYLKLLDNLKFT